MPTLDRPVDLTISALEEHTGVRLVDRSSDEYRSATKRLKINTPAGAHELVRVRGEWCATVDGELTARALFCILWALGVDYANLDIVKIETAQEQAASLVAMTAIELGGDAMLAIHEVYAATKDVQDSWIGMWKAA